MSIDEVLEKATREQKLTAIKDTPFKTLAEQGWDLYFGSKKIGHNRNQFWYYPKNKTVVIDYVNNLLHIVGNLLSPLETAKMDTVSLEEKQESDRLIMTSLGQINKYLAENMDIFSRLEIESSGITLGISNQEVYNDINEMRRRTFILNSIGVGTPEFVEKVNELIDFYREKIIPKYMPYDRELAKFRINQPPRQSSQ